MAERMALVVMPDMPRLAPWNRGIDLLHLVYLSLTLVFRAFHPLPILSHGVCPGWMVMLDGGGISSTDWSSATVVGAGASSLGGGGGGSGDSAAASSAFFCWACSTVSPVPVESMAFWSRTSFVGSFSRPRSPVDVSTRRARVA